MGPERGLGSLKGDEPFSARRAHYCLESLLASPLAEKCRADVVEASRHDAPRLRSTRDEAGCSERPPGGEFRQQALGRSRVAGDNVVRDRKDIGLVEGKLLRGPEGLAGVDGEGPSIDAEKLF